MRFAPLAALVLACATPRPVAQGEPPAAASPRIMLCRDEDKLVRIDTVAWRAQLFDSDQPVGPASCSTVAVAGADTRCLGSEFSVLYDSRAFTRALLSEPTGNTVLRCRPGPPPAGP